MYGEGKKRGWDVVYPDVYMHTENISELFFSSRSSRPSSVLAGAADTKG